MDSEPVTLKLETNTYVGVFKTKGIFQFQVIVFQVL